MKVILVDRAALDIGFLTSDKDDGTGASENNLRLYLGQSFGIN